MGGSSFAIANRKTRVGNMPYADTDETTDIQLALDKDAAANATSEAPSGEARTAATTRDTGGAAAPSKESQSAPVAPRKGRRGRTLASLDSSVNKPSILGG